MKFKFAILSLLGFLLCLSAGAQTTATTGIGIGMYTCDYYVAIYCNDLMAPYNESFAPTSYRFIETSEDQGPYIYGTTTLGSTSITAVANVSGLSFGSTLFGTGVASGATIVSVSGTTVVMSAAATATINPNQILVGLPSGITAGIPQTTLTGSLASGAGVMTGLSTTSGLVTGQGIQSSVLPTATMISGFTGTTITLTNSSTSSATSVTALASFIDSNAYNQIPANFLAGGTYVLTCAASFTTCSGGAVGSTGTIYSNSAGYISGPVSGVFSITGVGGTGLIGQKNSFILYGPALTAYSNLPAYLGWQLSGGVTFGIDRTSGHLPAAPVSGLPAPSQVLSISGGSGTSGTFQNELDTTAGQLNIILTGTYCTNVDLNLISGSATVSSFITRFAASSAYLNSTPVTVTGTGWHTYTVCTPSPIAETSATTPGFITVGWTVALGSTGSQVDVIKAQAPRQSHTALGPFSDYAIGLITQGGWKGTRLNGLGMLASGAGSSTGCSLQNLLLPTGYRTPCMAYQGGAIGNPYTAAVGVGIGLNDWFQLSADAGATKTMWMIPPQFTNAELAALPEFVNGSCGTTWGAIRCALGHTATWTSVFPQGIIWEFSNESWNGGQPGTTNFYPNNGLNYIPVSALAAQTMKSSSSWDSTKMLFTSNVQESNLAAGATLINNATPSGQIDAQDIAGYYQATTVNCTTAFQSYMVNAIMNGTNSAMDQYSIANTGLKMTRYEQATGTSFGNCTPQQLVFIAGMGGALADISYHMVMNRNFPAVEQNVFFFELSGTGARYGCYYTTPTYSSGSTYTQGAVAFSSGGQCYVSQQNANTGNAQTNTSWWLPVPSSGPWWGAYLGTGANGNARPTVYAQSIYNQCANMGSTLGGSVPSVPVYSQAAQNAIPIATNIPLILHEEFTDGTNTCQLYVNWDSIPHTVTVTGSQLPASASGITQRQLTSAAITDNNDTTPNTVVPTTTSFTPSNSLTLPRLSITALVFANPSVAVGGALFPGPH